MCFVVSDSCHKYISSSRGVRDGIICQVMSFSSSIYTVVSGVVWGLEAVLYNLMLCPLLRPWSLQLLSGVRYCGSILLSLMPWAVATPSVQAVLLLGASLQMTSNGKNLPGATSAKLKVACFFPWLWRCVREVYSGYLLVKKRYNRWQHQLSFMRTVNDWTVVFLWSLHYWIVTFKWSMKGN